FRGSGKEYGAPPSASAAHTSSSPDALDAAVGRTRRNRSRREEMAFMISRIYNRPMSYFIEFIDVSKSFDDRKILDQVSFGVEQAETFAILGPSGTGRT